MRKSGILILSIIAIILALCIMGCSKSQEMKSQEIPEPAEEIQQTEQAEETAEASPQENEPAEPGLSEPASQENIESTEAQTAETKGAEGITGNIVGTESQLKELETNTNILKKETIWGRAMEQKKFEDAAWFDAVNCNRYVGKPQGFYSSTGTKKEDKISFRLKNNEKKQFFLGYTKVLENIHRSDKETIKVPMVIRINGNRVRDIKECCGTDLLEPGQTLECNNCKANLRYEEDQVYMKDKTQMKNDLEATSDFVSTHIIFECRK